MVEFMLDSLSSDKKSLAVALMAGFSERYLGAGWAGRSNGQACSDAARATDTNEMRKT